MMAKEMADIFNGTRSNQKGLQRVKGSVGR